MSTYTSADIVTRVVNIFGEARRVGFAHIEANLKLRNISATLADILEVGVRECVGRPLSDVIWEFVGMEDVLKDVLDGDESLEIEKINRSTLTGENRYLNFMVVRAAPDDPSHGLLLLVEDVTEAGRLEQTLIQERNELKLVQSRLERELTERRRLEQEERDQRTQAEALRDISLAVNSTLDLEQVFERILENVARLVPYDRATIVLTQGESAYHSQSSGFSVERVKSTDETTSDEHYELRYEDSFLPDYASHLAEPIVFEGQKLGYIILEDHSLTAFSQQDIERLKGITSQASVAVRNATLYEKAQELAAVEERQHLARELHDAVSQTLFSASMIAQAMPRINPDLSSEIKEGLQELDRLTRGALAEMRILLVELRPRAIAEAKLSDLLRHLTDSVMGRSDIEVDLQVRGERRLPSDVQTNLYRIAQEGLNNVVKHARAQNAVVQLVHSSGGVTLTITDDGRGFEPEQVPEDHFGLQIMNERAEQINAEFILQSDIDNGTSVKVIWNLPSTREQS